jgi:hypothetical protein
MFGEVQLYCDAHPSASLKDATDAAYSKLTAQGK